MVHDTRKKSLQPFDYETGGVVGAMQRQELRAALRAMKPDERTSALQKFAYRSAALEQPSELSGIAADVAERLYEEEVRARFPEDIIDDAMEGAEVVALALKAATAAVEVDACSLDHRASHRCGRPPSRR